jgi:hypothetical protein
LEAREGELYVIETRLEVSKEGPELYRSIQNGVVCIEVYQRITSSKSNSIDVYREESQSKD